MIYHVLQFFSIMPELYLNVSLFAHSKFELTVFFIIYCLSVWMSNKTAKMYPLHKTKWYAAAFALRQRMLNFVQNFEYYMMFEVVEPNWHVFQANMDSVSHVSKH